MLRPAEIAAPTRRPATEGLTSEEAAQRLLRVGANELPPHRRLSLMVRLSRCLREPMSLLLLGAAAVSGFALGERLDAIAITAIVVINAAIALAQEGKASRALEALRRLEIHVARVVRGGRTRKIPTREIVPGDLVLLAAGDRVPADLRLDQAQDLQIDESMLTGESLPVAKSADAFADWDAPVAEREWMAFSGTLVTRGKARGQVLATGERTEVGRISEHLKVPDLATPLQRELARLTGRLGLIAVLVAAGVFLLTLVRAGGAVDQAFLSAVALAVAAVPEGLATVVLVGLAVGVRRMAVRGAIIRRLPAVETLGSASVILTDKTGTLTENRMRVEVAVGPEGTVPTEEQEAFLHMSAALCNDACLDPPSGDPMEVALLEWVGAERVEHLRARSPRLAESPFDAERRRMGVVADIGSGTVLLVKGAPEVILSRYGRAGGDALDLAGIAEAAEQLADQGRRVLAFAHRVLSAPLREGCANEDAELIFDGLVALRDPVRAEAVTTLALAGDAGIRIVMVTGDHAGTARAIARDVELLKPDEEVVTGTELRENGLEGDPVARSVYARVDPGQKLELVDAARRAGHVVAVTGDGVNDAPALHHADIGVAMGLSGSEVAREAADMVVTDDNLATVIDAIREGRGIYDNIRKVVDYLVAGNLSEILVVVSCLALFPGLGVPLLPLQLLWINLLTDGLPALALANDPPAPDLMRRPPRPRGRRLLDARRVGRLSVRGGLIATAALIGLVLARFVWEVPWTEARSVMFSTLVVAHLLYAFVARLPAGSLRANPWLIAAVAGGIALQVGAIMIPAAREVLGTAALTTPEWGLVTALGATPVILMLGLPRSLRTSEAA